MHEFALHDLPPSFLVTVAEHARFADVPMDIIEKHLQVITSRGRMFHLNPDLVPDHNAVRVCGHVKRSYHLFTITLLIILYRLLFTVTFTTIHVDTFHINYGTLDENRFNNVIVLLLYYSLGH